MAGIKTPTPLQLAALKAQKRFNIVAGARESGKTTLADRLVVRNAEIPGCSVVYGLPDAAELVLTRRRLFSVFGSRATFTQGKIFVAGGGWIRLMALDAERLELLEQVQYVIVDNATAVDQIYAVWEEVLLPALAEKRGHAWIFAKPRSARDGFGRLFREAEEQPAVWNVQQLPTEAQLHDPLPGDPPHIIAKLKERAAEVFDGIAKARESMDLDAFSQEYEAAVLDEPLELSVAQTIIGRDETFLDWCERLAADGLKVDEHPFKLDDRPTMRWVYSRIPSSIEEAFGKKLVLMKCAQVGFTVMEMLATIYLALKFMPCKVGMYLPDQRLAAIKSSDRFLPIVRTIPEVHKLLTDDHTGQKKAGEGNVMIRKMGPSRFYFMWTSGKATTESVPLDVLTFDEVQEMSISQMEKTSERVSASRVKYTLMGSTAKWPDKDIHFFYKKGTQHQFWTQCTACDEYQVLDEHFPACIKLRDGEYSYVCHSCGAVIEDSQHGEWRAQFPDAKVESIHYPQFLSPTVTPREMIEAYYNADDMMNYYNRKLGKPYLDPSQVPVSLEMLNDCARIGMEMGVKWKQRANGTFMGIDQMGAFNVVLIAERLPSGHMALIHAEEIYNEDPFARCDELMFQFGVSVCCVETLPNYNDAKRFASRHKGKVFLAGYGNMADEMLSWGDSVPNSAERKTSEEDRDRYTVRLDQYKCMQVAMKRIQTKVCVFPDPQGLVQEIKEKGLQHMVPVLKDRVFLHLTRTALIAEQDDEERKFKRKVVKVGLDPHFSYAFMLLNVAWARSHGTTMFITPFGDSGRAPEVQAIADQMPGLPESVLQMLEAPAGACGRCSAFDNGTCNERGFLVGAKDPGCQLFMGIDHN
jgi:hypothetical protein